MQEISEAHYRYKRFRIASRAYHNNFLEWSSTYTTAQLWELPTNIANRIDTIQTCCKHIDNSSNGLCNE